MGEIDSSFGVRIGGTESEYERGTKINRISDYLVILVATYNRLELLKKTIDSIKNGTSCSHEIVVIDGGSTDGTIEYLESSSEVTLVFQGELVGQVKVLNLVWKNIESKYTCWINDDTEIVNRSLDVAVQILETNPKIGMVGLKMRDIYTDNPRKKYGGAISCYGILNCNHGVLSTALLKSVGYIDDRFYDFLLDPDITAKVLCTGKTVVLTKKIGVIHHRPYESNAIGSTEKGHVQYPEEMKTKARMIYSQKYKFLENTPSFFWNRLECRLKQFLARILWLRSTEDSVRLGINRWDWQSITRARFINLADPVKNLFRSYHLAQRIRKTMLRKLENNPHYVSR